MGSWLSKLQLGLGWMGTGVIICIMSTRKETGKWLLLRRILMFF